MALSVAQLDKEIRSLNSKDKAALLQSLIAELDDTCDDDVERAWLEEVQRRYRELKDRTVKPVPAEVVFERAHARLAK